MNQQRLPLRVSPCIRLMMRHAPMSASARAAVRIAVEHEWRLRADRTDPATRLSNRWNPCPATDPEKRQDVSAHRTLVYCRRPPDGRVLLRLSDHQDPLVREAQAAAHHFVKLGRWDRMATDAGAPNPRTSNCSDQRGWTGQRRVAAARPSQLLAKEQRLAASGFRRT